METGLGSSHVQLGEHLLYDRFSRAPVWVLEDRPHGIHEREGYPDRNLASADRVELADYESQKSYFPCWLHSSIGAYSHSCPATRGLCEVYMEVDEWVHRLDGHVTTAQGPLYKAGSPGGTKWFRLGDTGPVIPHGIYRSVLQERDNHQLVCTSFLIANIASPAGICDALLPTASLERKLGWILWGDIRDEAFRKAKEKARPKTL